MQKIRLWEILPDQTLAEIEGNQVPLERQMEDWLKSDFSVIDPDLLVIGRQVKTDFGGSIDLLCLDSRGDTVVVELKKGRTPREVTAQALDYVTWVKDLSVERLSEIFERESQGKPSLASKFRDKFEDDLPDQPSLDPRILLVAEEIDPITERIVRYLSEKGVPINAATVQHFRDKDDRKFLAKVHLMEPEEAESRTRSVSKRRSVTLHELQEEADKNGIGEMFRRIREKTRDILLARPYSERIWYGKRLEDGRQRAVLIVFSIPSKGDSGMPFVVHITRFDKYLSVSEDKLREWLPNNTRNGDVNHWSGSSPEERENARGLGGSFQSLEEVERFLAGLRSREQP